MVDYAAVSRTSPSHVPPALSLNELGTSPFLLVCDHASNRIPEIYGDLGLTPLQRLMHIAWDPGALGVARHLGELLDAPLVHSTVSRLVIDCNRTLGAPDLIPTRSESTDIPGNQGVDRAERDRRLLAFHAPYHAEIERLLALRAQQGRETILAAVHSFTPYYHGEWRPWPIGIIPGRDPTFSQSVRAALLAEEPALNVGWNQPYSSLIGVTYTLEHHGDGRGLPAVMFEIRHDEILTPAGVELWAGRLARALKAAQDILRAGDQHQVEGAAEPA